MVVAFRRKKARRNRRSPLPAGTRYRGRSHHRRWSRRTTTTIAQELARLEIAVSPNSVSGLLHDLGYSLRVNQKQISTKNPGQRWESAPRCVYDHDFRTDSVGVAIPYGIYDVTENCGALVVGVSHDTPAFAAHAIAFWWQQEGSIRYRVSRQLLILADTGSNSCRCYAGKLKFSLSWPTRSPWLQP